MSADSTNGPSNIDVILKAMAPERREAFLRACLESGRGVMNLPLGV